jgi:hypothetical protein
MGKWFFNSVAALFAVLTLVMVGIVVAIAADAMDPPLFAPEKVVILPTRAVFSSPTPGPSWTPSNTPLPTGTFTPTPPFTPLPTFTPTITNTPGPTGTFTLTPTRTPAPPTFTPTRTPTPTASSTPTITPLPTGPTPTPQNTLSAYPFIVQPSSLILREYSPEPDGCTWQGVGGQVTTARGEPVKGIQVRVVGDSGGAWSARSGTNQTYGAAGWEIKVSSETNNGRYEVSLWANGVQVSPSVVIVFPNACQQNLATVNFIQTRPY